LKLHLIMGNFDGMRSINAEILFKTARSGGKGGQNVNELVKKALIIPKKRKATKPTKEAKEKRMETKRKNAFQKQLRQKISAHE